LTDRSLDTQSLADAGFQVLQLWEVLHLEDVVSDYSIDFSLGCMIFLGVLQQLIEQEGQRSAGGFMSSSLVSRVSLTISLSKG
jgi:hypothetical protein